MKTNIKEIISNLTLQEKATLCVGYDFWHLSGIERFDIPKTMVSDGPHGLRKQDMNSDHLGINDSIKAVCFPAACATAASFDEELLESLGNALGEECKAEDVSIILGPAVNIKRSPLCGRNFEYFSEDPYLTGKLSAAQIKGVQKWDVGTSIKHFAANNQEYKRQSCSSQIDERTLREIYLRGFEIAIKESQPWTVMCSYNKVNGTYASENKYLLTDILRNEWGFNGYVMSDWGAVNDRIKALKAGLDLEMPASGGYTTKYIVDAVNNGSLDINVLDKSVERILNTILKYTNSSLKKPSFNFEKHHKLAVDIEKECAVLLKNKGVLPIKQGETVAFIGGFAKLPRYQGGGSSHINAFRVSNAFDEAKEKYDNIFYAQGFSTTQDMTDENLFNEAIALAKKVKKVVVFAGLPDSFESEGYDRTHMRLPDCQNALIQQLAQVNKNLIIVLHNGSPVEMPWVDNAAAILEMYLGGQGVGEATVSLLFGEANPCGRLAETFPVKLSDNPSCLNFPGYKGKVDYSEGIYVGYRYYDKKEMDVLFPFGHGLSYSQFQYSDFKLSNNTFTNAETITLSLYVTNISEHFGKEVIQLYVSDKSGAVYRPDKELKGFKKIALNPRERKCVTFEIDAESLAYYDVDLKDWYAKSGTYNLMIGKSSRNIIKELAVEFIQKRKPFFNIDLHTTFGELLEDERTCSFAENLLKNVSSSEQLKSDAFPKEALKKMAESVPLSFLQGFFKLTPDELNNMINQLHSML